MALDVLEQIQEPRFHEQAPQQHELPAEASKGCPLEQVDIFLKEAVNSRNRITVLRLEQEIEKFARNLKQQDLLLKPMTSSYERLAAHRVAQHYGLQSMVVSALSPKVSRILLVKTPESRLPCVRLVDIPLDTAFQDKPASGPQEKFAIKQRESGVLNADGGYNGSADSERRTPLKTMEEREEEYDKARARIFSNGDVVSGADEESRVSDGASPQKTEEKLADSSLVSRGIASPNGEDKSLPANSNRVAIFRDREKDMRDPDYDRNYKRYTQQLEPRMSTGFSSMQRMYTSPVNFNKECMRLDGSWGPQGQMDQSSCVAALHFRGPWVGSGYPDVFYGHFTQGHSDAYLQKPRFASHPGHYGYIDDGFQYPFQPGLQPTSSLGTLGR